MSLIYKVKMHRSADGGYDLTFGRKGPNMLMAHVTKRPAGTWGIDSGHGCGVLPTDFVKVKDLKIAWGNWVQAHRPDFSRSGVPSAAPTLPPIPKRSLPPLPKPIKRRTDFDVTYTANPFDPAFRDADRQLTP